MPGGRSRAIWPGSTPAGSMVLSCSAVAQVRACQNRPVPSRLPMFTIAPWVPESNRTPQSALSYLWQTNMLRTPSSYISSRPRLSAISVPQRTTAVRISPRPAIQRPGKTSSPSGPSTSRRAENVPLPGSKSMTASSKPSHLPASGYHAL